MAVFIVAVILSVAGTIRAHGRAIKMSLPIAIALSATAYALLALVRLAPGYISPHYSIRDTSRQLGSLLANGSGTVATSRSEGLFLENTLRYTMLHWPADTPDAIVIVFAFDDPQDRLAREYCKIGEYPLYVAPEYYRAHPTFSPTSGLGETVRVYRRRVSSHCGTAIVPPRS